MSIPQRIQLSRKRGYRKPEGCIVVSRPSRFGNPFRADVYGLNLCLALYRQAVEGSWNPSLIQHFEDPLFHETYRQHCEFRKRFDRFPCEAAITELRGYSLACWCPLPKPGEPDRCHAAVLLEIANKE